jgi:hypothetical protein
MDYTRIAYGKIELKKFLQSMDKTELVSLILEMYSTKKEIAEYLDYYVSPNEKEQFLRLRKLLKTNIFQQKAGLKTIVCCQESNI